MGSQRRVTSVWDPGSSKSNPRSTLRLVEYLRLILVVINSTAFLALTIMSIWLRRREKHTWVRRLWVIIALVCGALVVGSFQRIAIQVVAVGWLPESVGEAFTSDLQLIQSLVVLIFVLAAFVTMRRLADMMENSERLTVSLLDRVRHVDPESLHLTNRESEVLALIGEGVTTDSRLAAELHISASTVQSHVKSLLRKTDLNSRTDLVAVAILMSQH